MAVNLKIRELLQDGAIVFDNHAYDNSIIGLSEDGRVVYDYDKMVQELCKDEGWDELTAMEWIDYNTIRALPYISNPPIIMYPLEE